jgi:hypothetical protein
MHGKVTGDIGNFIGVRGSLLAAASVASISLRLRVRGCSRATPWSADRERCMNAGGLYPCPATCEPEDSVLLWPSAPAL